MPIQYKANNYFFTDININQTLISKMEKIEVNLTGDQKELVLRTGSALPLHELKTLSLNGTLQAPGDFLDIRKDQFPIDETHVIVNLDEGIIALNSMDREDVGKIIINGSLETHQDFIRMGINDPEITRQPNDLASWIKMNRTFFESKTVAMNLVSLLRNFKATVNKKLEDSSDDRANYAKLREQAVESNLPDTFKITMPLFVGDKPVTFDVEVVIDPDDFSCNLISPDAADLIKTTREKKLNEEIARFDGYAIIYK
jgi:hypothetical protein